MSNLINQLARRVAKHEKLIRNFVVDDDSGSFQSAVTSGAGGKGSVSASWSANLELVLPFSAQTSGTGSANLSLPGEEGLPGA